MESTRSTCCIRLKKELAWKALGLEENNPSKFATTAWTRTQYPFLAYRFICFVYSASIISWNIYLASKYPTTLEVAAWFLSFPTWSFLLFTLYKILALLLVSLNFYDDCLCNDDLSWYHKVCWVFHVVSYNTTTSCLIGKLLHIMAEANNDSNMMLYTSVFNSDDINFYIISALVMMIDVLIHNISVRLLHFVYPSTFFLAYLLFHVYRWAAGYAATLPVFEFGSLSPAVPIMFLLITMLIYAPLIHATAYAIDSLRRKLLVSMWERKRKSTLHTANSSFHTSSSNPRTLQTAASDGYVSKVFQEDIYDDQGTLEIFQDDFAFPSQRLEESNEFAIDIRD